MARITMGYPARSSEVAMLTAQAGGDQLATVRPVTTAQDVAAASAALQQVYVAPAINDYIVSIVEATRNHADLRLGASPRASLHLMRASRAAAALRGRDYVIPEDVAELCREVLEHRLLTTVEAQVAGRTPGRIVKSLLERVPTPGRG